MWHLHARAGRRGQGAARHDPEPERGRDSRVDAWQSVSLHRLLQDRRIDPGRGGDGAIMNAFEYRAPRALDEALTFLREFGEEARAVAGGTALVNMMRQRLVRPSCLVRLRDVED